jgi:pimeloyl-ACP methyl ester carboxylesterase
MLHRHCVIDGMRLHWAEMGKHSRAAPIVLLHGINDSHLTWKRVAPLLAPYGRVLMPDLPGCGLSERPDASYTLAWHARVVAKWLSHLRLENADFVGHSFGGGVAQMLLLERPARIRRLALVAPGGLGRDVGVWLRLAAVAPRAVELLGQPFMSLGTRLALLGAPFSEDDVMERCAMNAAAGTARAFARTAQDVIDWRGQSRLFVQRAHEIEALPPIALYWGDRDTLIPITQGTAFARAVNGVMFRPFPGCGHYLHHEQPEAFVSALREFLDLPHAEAACIRVAPPQVAQTLVLPKARHAQAVIKAASIVPYWTDTFRSTPHTATARTA